MDANFKILTDKEERIKELEKENRNLNDQFIKLKVAEGLLKGKNEQIDNLIKQN